MVTFGDANPGRLSVPKSCMSWPFRFDVIQQIEKWYNSGVKEPHMHYQPLSVWQTEQSKCIGIFALGLKQMFRGCKP
jgi:hypothetical protein